MAVEPRDGKLNVFMPPIAELEDYLDLLAAVEETAQYLGVPVLVEGYPPPGDPRLNVIKVTPDPGVIEVNVHPANSWQEMIEITTGVYDEARQTRLGNREVYARWAPQRHRWRQSPHRGRFDTRG